MEKLLTDADITAIKERMSAIKTGPWYANENDLIGGWCVGTFDGHPSEDTHADDIADLMWGGEATFIAHARTDVPALLTTLAAREAEVGRLKYCLDGLLLSYSGFTKSLGYDWEETKMLPAIDDAIAALADHTP